MIIGYYNIANFITLAGLASSVLSCLCAFNGNIQIAVMFLMISGLCDTFDGKVARSLKRSEKSKVFGVQIDTVADMVSFGVTPAIIGYSIGMNRWFECIILMFFVICAAIRLAYFNTLEITCEDQNAPKTYVGLPVPFSAIFFPLAYILIAIINGVISRNSLIVIDFIYVLTAIAFVLNFKLKKPQKIIYMIFPIYEMVIIILYYFWGNNLNV